MRSGNPQNPEQKGPSPADKAEGGGETRTREGEGESEAEGWQTHPSLIGSDETDFEYMQVLGGGGFGVVSLVRHMTTNKPFALKVIKRCDILPGHDINDEAAIMKAFSHPLAVKLLHSFVPKTKLDMLCLVLEYVKGGTFVEVFQNRCFDTRNRRPLSEKLAQFYVAELVSVLLCLHAKGVVYRDLKPDNFMLRSTGHLCLIDFGIARRVKGGGRHRRCRTRIGADGYKAPEVISIPKVKVAEGEGGEYDGFAVDWWNLGIIMYMFLKGKHPFRKKYTTRGLDKAILRRRKKVSLKKQCKSNSAGNSPITTTSALSWGTTLKRVSRTFSTLTAGKGKKRDDSGIAGFRGSGADIITQFSDEEDEAQGLDEEDAPRVSFVKSGGKLMTKPIEGVSVAANELVLSLLEADPEVRLKNVQDIRSHAFFQGIDWPLFDKGHAFPPTLKTLHGRSESVLQTWDESSREPNSDDDRFDSDSDTERYYRQTNKHNHRSRRVSITPVFKNFSEMLDVVERSKHAEADFY